MHLDLSALKRANQESAQTSSLVQGDDVLSGVYIFEGFSQEFQDSILSRCDRESFASGTQIIREGDESNGKAYIILSGSAEVYIAGALVATLSVGDIFGEYALICAENRTATVQVVDPVECLILDEDTLIKISNENNQINDTMIKRINENARASEDSEGV